MEPHSCALLTTFQLPLRHSCTLWRARLGEYSVSPTFGRCEADAFQVASFGVDANLVRVSVGLEAAADLCAIFERALIAIASI